MKIRHATARAMERLRWPVSASRIDYIFPITKLACGPEYLSKETRNGLHLFREEDADALLHEIPESVIERYHGKYRRTWKMPTCPDCAVELDWALSNPYVIHATRSFFKGRLTPQEKLDEQRCLFKPCFCGAPQLQNTPIFTMLKFERAKREYQIDRVSAFDRMPTCETCRAAVIKHFGL